MNVIAREIRIASFPAHEVSAANFEIVETALPDLAEGEVLVRNTWFSLDPYMRLPLTGRRGVHGSLKPGATMDGGAVGVVAASRAADLPEGTPVLSQRGWRDAFVARSGELLTIDAALGPPQWRLGVLGLTGITAFAGVELVLQPNAGETLFVSGAAGAVGMVACQLAKARGARVLGSAGSDAKVQWLKDRLGVDDAVNYRSEDIDAFLRRTAPDGLDAYFDNVGGSTMDAVLRTIRVFGRIGLCGAIAQYNDDNYRAGPSEYFAIIEKGLTVTGFNAGLAHDRTPEILAVLSRLLKTGALVWEETVVDGLDAAPAAFASLFAGANTGKLLVRLPD